MFSEKTELTNPLEGFSVNGLLWRLTTKSLEAKAQRDHSGNAEPHTQTV